MLFSDRWSRFKKRLSNALLDTLISPDPVGKKVKHKLSGKEILIAQKLSNMRGLYLAKYMKDNGDYGEMVVSCHEFDFAW